MLKSNHTEAQMIGALKQLEGKCQRKRTVDSLNREPALLRH
jgi:hypothetical protein